jgi:hypothetical protein
VVAFPRVLYVRATRMPGACKLARYKAVNYTGLTMALIEAAKELVSRCRYRDCAGLAFIRPSPLV